MLSHSPSSLLLLYVPLSSQHLRSFSLSPALGSALSPLGGLLELQDTVLITELVFVWNALIISHRYFFVVFCTTATIIVIMITTTTTTTTTTAILIILIISTLTTSLITSSMSHIHKPINTRAPFLHKTLIQGDCRHRRSRQ